MTGAPPRPVLPADVSPREVVLWAVNVLNRHDAESLRQVLGPQTLYRTPQRTDRGADRIVEQVAALHAAVPDAAITALAAVAEGDTVFLRWRLTGTHTGAEYEGIAPTGARIDIDGVDHLTVDDRTITSSFMIYDQRQLARQLGLVPAEGSRVDLGIKYAFNTLTRLRQRG